MEKCFMIQPFDGGRFDKRYDDVFAPAIRSAGLEPYRVDRDLGVTIPIEDIESGIASSRACLADITTDNPNVWFEVGYAIASHQPVVLICSKERTSPFPFDIRHRNIITYSAESSSDFDQLREHITRKLAALLEKEMRLCSVASMSPVAPVEGLEQYEIAALIAVAQELEDPTGGVLAYLVREDMQKTGFTKIACTLAVRGLLSNEMLEAYEEEQADNSFEGSTVYMFYRVTDQGMRWLVQNQNRLKLIAAAPAQPPGAPEQPSGDEIPF